MDFAIEWQLNGRQLNAPLSLRDCDMPSRESNSPYCNHVFSCPPNGFYNKSYTANFLQRHLSFKETELITDYLVMVGQQEVVTPSIEIKEERRLMRGGTSLSRCTNG